MRRLILYAALLQALFSCSKPSLFERPPRWYTDRARGPETADVQVDSSAMNLPPRKGVYVTAIRFPEWARWREGDYRGAEAVLFRDSVEISSAPLGSRPDAERLRLWNGHLWTDIADEGVTRIYRDSVEHTVLPQEQLLRGFLIENDSLYTLGQRPGGGGLIFSVNGEERFSTPTGTALGSPWDREWEGGALMSDSTGVYYVYGIPFHKGDQITTEYHVMRGANDIKTIPPNSSGAIYDIRVRDGTIWRCERRNNSPQSLCLVKEDMFLALDIGSNEDDLYGCKLIPLRDEIMIKGGSETTSGNLCWIRSQSGVIHANNWPGVHDLYMDGLTAAFLVIEDGLVSKIYKDYKYFPVTPGRYKLMSSRCADFAGGFFALALSDATSDSHLLILDGKHVPMNFNGYFTSLKIIQ